MISTMASLNTCWSQNTVTLPATRPKKNPPRATRGKYNPISVAEYETRKRNCVHEQFKRKEKHRHWHSGWSGSCDYLSNAVKGLNPGVISKVG